MAISLGTGNTSSLTNSTSISFSKTTSVGATLLIASFKLRDTFIAATISNVKYGGFPLYQAIRKTDTSSNFLSVDIWYLSNPPSGANTFTATVSDATPDCRADVSDWLGVYAPRPLLKTNSGSSSTGSPSITIAPQIANCLIVDAMSGEGLNAATQNGSPATLSNIETPTDEGGWNSASGYVVQTTNLLQTMAWTQASDQWASAVAVFAPDKTSMRINTLRPHAFSPGLAR